MGGSSIGVSFLKNWFKKDDDIFLKERIKRFSSFIHFRLAEKEALNETIEEIKSFIDVTKINVWYSF